MALFPMTEALFQSNAWPVERQGKARREFSLCRLTASLCFVVRLESYRPVRHWDSEAMGCGKQRSTVSVFHTPQLSNRYETHQYRTRWAYGIFQRGLTI